MYEMPYKASESEGVDMIFERCPSCQALNVIPEHEVWVEGKQRLAAPADVVCRCGLKLRAIVPIFKASESGWIFRPLLPSEKFREKGNGKKL